MDFPKPGGPVYRGDNCPDYESSLFSQGAVDLFQDMLQLFVIQEMEHVEHCSYICRRRKGGEVGGTSLEGGPPVSKYLRGDADSLLIWIYAVHAASGEVLKKPASGYAITGSDIHDGFYFAGERNQFGKFPEHGIRFYFKAGKHPRIRFHASVSLCDAVADVLMCALVFIAMSIYTSKEWRKKKKGANERIDYTEQRCESGAP